MQMTCMLHIAAKHATNDWIVMLVPGNNAQGGVLAGNGTQAWLTLSKRTSLSSLKRRM